jgi:hypothetical protein
MTHQKILADIQSSQNENYTKILEYLLKILIPALVIAQVKQFPNLEALKETNTFEKMYYGNEDYEGIGHENACKLLNVLRKYKLNSLTSKNVTGYLIIYNLRKKIAYLHFQFKYSGKKGTDNFKSYFELVTGLEINL